MKPSKKHKFDWADGEEGQPRRRRQGGCAAPRVARSDSRLDGRGAGASSTGAAARVYRDRGAAVAGAVDRGAGAAPTTTTTSVVTAPRFSRFTTISSPPTSGAHRSALARLRKLKNKYSLTPPN